MSDARLDELREVYHGLGAFARYVQLKRTLALCDDAPTIDFWRIIYGGLTNLAVIEWCKFFGSPRNNHFHWARVFQSDVDGFRIGLLEAAGTEEAEYDRYQQKLTIWRDKDFAHRDRDLAEVRPEQWPEFSVALAAADYYFARVVADMQALNCHPIPYDLAHFRKVADRQYGEAAKLALAATQHIQR